MLYLIGGAARAGKTLITQRMFREKRTPYVCIDYLVSGLDQGAPALDIDAESPNLIRGEKVWPVLEPMLRNIVEVEPRYTVDGDILFPKYVRQLSAAYPDKIRAVFLGYANISAPQKLREIRSFGGGVNDWLQDHDDGYILALVEEMIEFSAYLQAECLRCGISYFDTSSDFTEAVDRAYDYLISLQI
ncbi:MAG: hypothetical protein IT210_10325 [Armatimonadetes bacterium]|nr:hypothetical protein [Armatimonadota bacterium]